MQVPFGVYIHFPFCLARCPYCDFAIHVRPEIPHDGYTDAILREFEARATDYAGRQLVSIYFGGGTPSLWKPSCIERIATAVANQFTHPGEIEMTVEANPEALPLAQLEALRAAGCNRLSLGVQSLQPHHLKTLGRPHDARTVQTVCTQARTAGFDHLSLDLIFAVPHQTLADLDRDLDGLFALSPDHLSIYSLTIEERTEFGARARRGRLTVAAPELEATMFEYIDRRARQADFEHYEVSSFARPGHRALHNQLYWSGGEWLGLGSGAHSFRRTSDGGERQSNVRSVDLYLRGEALTSRELLSESELAGEAIWLGLRQLVEGVDRERYAARFGVDPVARFRTEFERLTRQGVIEITSARVRLTARGALFADGIAANFL